jgi:hypothetical protein
MGDYCTSVSRFPENAELKCIIFPTICKVYVINFVVFF